MNKIYTVLKGRFFVGMKLMLLAGIMMGGGKSWGQAASATWGLTSDGTVSLSGNISSSTQSLGSVVGTESFGAANGCSANNFASASLSNNAYYEYSVTPTIGNNLTISSISFYYSVSGGSMNAAVYYSLDNFSSSNVQLGSNITGFSNTSSTVQFTNSSSIVVNSGITLKIRVYGWAASATTRTFRNKTFIITGTTSSSCTPPTAQAAFSSFANISTSQADLNFVAGTGGIGRLIAASQAASVTGSPSSGTAYTTGLTSDFSTTTPTIATGEKVIYKSNGTSTTVTGLSAETQYAVKVFEYNTSDCYLTTGTGNTGSFYTLSNEPAAQAASLFCNASAYNQIDLTFPSITAAGITNADGYIILQKIGSAPTGLPADAASYTVGATVGDATVAAIVNSTSATTQSITGLSAGTNYYYTLIPYNALGTGTIAATYNYLTAGTIPGSNCTTPVTPPGITVSASTLTGFTYVQSAGPSASQTYNVSGTNLTPASGNINIAASTDYEVSLDNSTFSSTSVNIAYTGGALVATPVYIRLKAGLSAGSYNSEIIANTGGGAAAKNVTVSGTVSSSGTSNIIEDGDASFYVPNTVNIAYTTWQSASITNTGSGTNGSIGVFRFKIQDGGASSPDADALPTIVTGITFNYTGTAGSIRTAALFSGSAKVADVTTVNANSLVFSSLTDPVFTVADNGSQVLTLRVTFNTAVTDNDKLVYSVGSAASAAAATSSQFGTISATSDNNTGNDRNRIEVTADRLRFTTQPADQSANTNLAAFVIKGTDANNNTDLDAANSFALTTSGTGMTSSSPYTLSAGVKSISDVQFNAAQGPITLTVTTTGLSFDNDDVSGAFNISSVASGSYRTTAAGTWNGTATWERFSAGWVSSGAPASGNVTDMIYIRHAVSFVGSMSFGKITVATGGTLTNSASSTIGALLVQTGGTYQMNANLTISTSIEVEDNAAFNFNYSSYSTTGLNSTLWNGAENFHPLSNFVVQDYSNSTNDYLIPGTASVSANTYNSFSACFGNLIFDCSAASGGTLQILPSATATINLTHNDLIFRTSNTASSVRISDANYTLTIGGNLTMESGFGMAVSCLNSTNTAILNINGNLNNLSAKEFRLMSSGATTSVTVNVKGNINLAGTASLNFNATNSGTSQTNIINLYGDITAASTSVLTNTNSNLTGKLNFAGTGDGLTAATTQTIDIASAGAARNQYTDFGINSGAYVQLINQNFELGKNSTVAVKTGGILDFNFAGTTPLNITNYSTTPGFTSAQGSTLKITSADGISNTSGAAGNVQLTTAPSYNQTATFWYIGKTNQNTGTGLTIGSTGKIVYVNLLDNTKTLTLTNNIGISNGTTLDALGGKLEIQKGIVLGTTAADFTGSGRLVMSDGEYKISTITAAPLTNYLPQLSGYSNYSLTGGTVHLNGANAIQILSGTPNYYKTTFSGSNTLGTNYKGISSAASVASAISIAETAVVDVKSFTLGASGSPSFTMTETARYITDGGGTKPDAGGTYSLGAGTTIEFANTGGAGVIRLGSPAIDYANIVVSGTNVSNTSTGTGIKFLSAGTFTVKTGATFKLFNSAGFSNATGSNATALSNLSPSNPTVTLEAGSNIDYAGATQTITNVTAYQNLILSGNGVKNAPATILTLMGDFTKTATATFSHDSGTVAFPGTTPQAYNSSPSITDFYNVTTSNAAGLTINNNMSIAGELALTGSANLKLAAGDVTLKSSSAKTASFATLPATASVTYTGAGLFSVERFINASRKWRFLSVNTATTQSINTAWQEAQAANANGNAGYGVIITDASATAPGVNGFDQSSFTPSMKYFDPAINDYTGVANTSVNIAAHDAYMTYVRGDRTCTPGNALTATTVLRTKGTLKTGDQTYTVTNAGDFAAIGNPYASRVSISNLQMTGLQDYIYIWDPKIAGAYSLGGFQTLQKIGGVWKFPISLGGSYPSGINVPMDSIESGQAFFVRAQAAGATITFKETSKAAGSHDVNFAAGQPASLIAVLKNAAGEGVDAAAVQYDDQNSNSIDFGDALKMSNTSENVSIKSSSLLAIEQRKNVTATDTVRLNVTGYKVGNYQWNFKLVNMDAPGLTAFVKDNFLNTLSPLNMNGDNNINFTISSAAGSYAADRFSVVFRPASVVAVTLTGISAQRLADKSVRVSWKSENEAGTDHYEIQHSEGGITFSALAVQGAANNAGGTASYFYNDVQPYAGINYYQVKSVSTSGAVNYTAVVKLLPVNEKASFSVSPNPVKDKRISLQAVAQAPGDYKVQLVNNGGQVIYKGLITVSGNAFVQRIQLPANTAAGNYKLSVTDAAGHTQAQSIIIE